uniref:Capsid protein n=1 Tax=Hymenopteran tombus-related virus TaxID=2822555 RepID=A0A8A6RKR0_9TOMB|nr:hypothetical protein [Hymenopteran tombus-related virus]
MIKLMNIRFSDSPSIIKMLNPYRGRGRGTNAALNIAAAAGGMAARVATDRLINWFSTPSQTQRMVMPGPSNTQVVRGSRGRGRGRGRGGRRRGANSRPAVTHSGAKVVVRDTEVIGSVTSGTVSYMMNPSCTEMPRLAAYEKMYSRYKVNYFNISFKSTSGTAISGSVTVGVEIGTKDDNIKDAKAIQKLRPMFVVPAWKSDTIALGSEFTISRALVCGDKSNDGVAFTLYVSSTHADLGIIQVSYEVEFSFPRPFQ